MEPRKCSILTITPYRVLPARSGGQLGIVLMHHYLGLQCPDHMASTKDNGPADEYAFELHKVFATSAARYIPLAESQKLVTIGKTYDANAVFCDHPYMALTAMWVAKKLNTPWYMRAHNIEAQRFRDLGKKWWKLLSMYERYAMQQADGIFFVSKEDAQWAISNYHLDAAKVHVAPFGTPVSSKPDTAKGIKEKLSAELDIPADKQWAYFLGVLDYKPNSDAVQYLLNEVLPIIKAKGAAMEILIAGKGLSEQLQQRIKETEGIRYLGFVPDLDMFLNACDVMLNPVLTGGGIKTKLVEALGYNKIAVSTHSGAFGLAPQVCGNNLIITPDNDWQAFANAAIHTANITADIPASFYENYYWGNVATKMISVMAR